MSEQEEVELICFAVYPQQKYLHCHCVLHKIWVLWSIMLLWHEKSYIWFVDDTMKKFSFTSCFVCLSNPCHMFFFFCYSFAVSPATLFHGPFLKATPVSNVLTEFDISMQVIFHAEFIHYWFKQGLMSLEKECHRTDIV